jgi:hypothetical protein
MLKWIYRYFSINLLDPHVPPMPFREELYQNAKSGKVRIGYFETIDKINRFDGKGSQNCERCT